MPNEAYGNRPSSDEQPAADKTHFWIECPGCVAGSSIGVPHGYAADTVVCPRCRQIVRVRETDRVLWRGHAESVSNDGRGRDAELEPVENIAPSWIFYRDEDGVGREAGVSFRGTSESREGAVVYQQPLTVDRFAWLRQAAGRRRRSGQPAGGDRVSDRRRGSWCTEEPRLRRWLLNGAAILPVALSAAAFVMAFSISPRPRTRKTVALRAAEAPPDGSSAAVKDSTGNHNQHVKPATAADEPPEDGIAPRPSKRQKAGTRKAQNGKSPERSSRSKRPTDDDAREPPMPRPSRQVMLYRRAIARLKAKNYSGALDDLDEVLLTSPSVGRGRYYRAEALAGLGRLGEALGELNEAIGAKPRDPWPWRARGLLHARLHQWLPAAADLREAIVLERNKMGGFDDPFIIKVADKLVDVVDQLDRHASGLVKERRFAAALDELSEVLKHQPNSASARLRRAVVYTQLHDDDRALEDFDVALWLRPGPAQAYGARAAIHERRRDDEAALADLAAAVKLAPERADYRERQQRMKNRLSAERWGTVMLRRAAWKAE